MSMLDMLDDPISMAEIDSLVVERKWSASFIWRNSSRSKFRKTCVCRIILNDAFNFAFERAKASVKGVAFADMNAATAAVIQHNALWFH